MSQYDKLVELLKPALSQNKLKLYDVKWTSEKSNKILQVSITNSNDEVDIDTCALASTIISDVLDKEESLNFPYTLEVCSPGAEREIKDLSQLKNLINHHFYIRLKHSINSLIELKCDLMEYGDKLKFSYKDKARVKKIEVEFENIDFIRLAVRI